MNTDKGSQTEIRANKNVLFTSCNDQVQPELPQHMVFAC